MSALAMKYGGSSLSSVQQIQQVAQMISQKKEAYDDIVVVVSAMGKTTNGLIEMAQTITETPNKREMDVLLSTGEQISISLLSIALNALNHKSISLTGWQAGIKTYGSAMKQKIKDIDLTRIKQEHENGNIVIVAGFQGYDEENKAILSFAKESLNEIPVGNHKLVASGNTNNLNGPFIEGADTPEGTVQGNNGKQPGKPSDFGDNGDGDKSSDKKQSDNPKTGDTSQVIFFTALLIASLITLVIQIRRRLATSA